MKKRRQYFLLTGIGLFTVVVLVLLVSSDFIFSPAVTVIGSDLNKASSNQVTVTTKTDLGDPAVMAAFPYDIGKWHGSDYDTAGVAKQLGATVMLMRGYDPETFSQPMVLTIVQSKSNSSFHAPDYCFPVQGYTIQENTRENLDVTDAAWTKGPSTLTLPLNKLVLTKNNKSGQISERIVVLYFYIKGNQFYSDMITMIEVQALGPRQGSYQGTLDEEKDFIGLISPLLFQPGKETGRPLISNMAQKGPAATAPSP
jgi:hypothetical protein